ncbi:MAG: UDP-N-acetylmuramoyl-tripeptide--D-alanyl-D-alanine ligase [Lachnospiraceae bacterium]|nr:UDP-N-acetylmuramoyl-tripeptide--D-alanyl-D-alanine ligase [Lachnospiraceae bacterium]
MKNMTIRNLVKVTGGRYEGPSEKLDYQVKGIVKDNREIKEGYVFVPFKGAKVDAHDFMGDAFEKGAVLCLSERPYEVKGDEAVLFVSSTLEAFKAMATFYREQLSCKFIGVVGSVGKTSTKEMIASVLETKYNVQKTAGNFNNEIGLPITIFSVNEDHEIAIVEMGISDFGEMKILGEIAKPDMVVMTNIGECHLENLIDRDGVLKEKSEVISYMKEGGTLVLNMDDDKLSTIKAPETIDVLTYGKVSDNTAYATEISSVGIQGQKARFHLQGQEFEATIPLSGEHNVYNALAAMCVAKKLGLSTAAMKDGMEKIQSVKGRNHQINANGYTIIDDCYNASPTSMKGSLQVLSHAKGRTIAILGDMGELGKDEKKMHEQVGEVAGDLGIDVIITVGALAKEIAKGAANHGCKVCEYETKEDLLPQLKELLKEGDTVLVKASHFMQFEKIVDAIK